MVTSFVVLGCAIELERRAKGETSELVYTHQVVAGFRAYLADVEKQWTGSALAKQYGIGLNKPLLSGLAAAYGRSDSERGFPSARYFPVEVVIELHEKLRQLTEQLESLCKSIDLDPAAYATLVDVFCKIHRPLVGAEYVRPQRFAA